MHDLQTPGHGEQEDQADNDDQALRTLKRMQSKALEWKVLRSVPKITLAEAEGRDRVISEQTEQQIQEAKPCFAS